MLEHAGVTVVHAAAALPGWRALADVRNEVGVRGPLHSAEKLVDHFGARRFIVGHTHSSYTDRLLAALALLEAERAVAVRGIEGSDVMRPGRPLAFTPAGPVELPERLGATLRDGGGAEASALATRAVLAGEDGELLEYAVALSAGLRLHAAGLARDPLQGAAVGRAAIADGRALATLRAMLSGPTLATEPKHGRDGPVNRPA
jgi:anthranilate phosphoribosyltransferase